ncbi:conserved hypothetical protein [Candidatus Nitrospira nitrosa]|uniref:Uncharacterized protein n=1 Tax=Candidatus Nitrospira nitrosa TaxID=1742972 RepID=A0A0S4LRV2_9BACT|nr:hypothetical protein [Candidatus Nitrospira nitrosa]CUS37826.1 conserved hypothetical protein [Candidatus Nitrospira nitrosa]
MLKLDDIRTLHGYQVHGDTDGRTFYILPKDVGSVNFARLSNGGLALRFVEYTHLREDGDNQFGGFIAFDTELSIPLEDEKNITVDLQKEVDDRFRSLNLQPPAVQIAPINWTDGTVKLILTEDGKMIEKIRGAGKPSLYGRNIASFMMELSLLGTAIFKKALSTGAASAIQVVYELNYFGKLPKMIARGEWHATEFYSFFQDINTEDNFWSEDSYTEIVSSSRYKNDVTKTSFDFIQIPNLKAEDQAKLEKDIRDHIMKQLETKVQQNLLKEIQAVDPNTKELREGQDIEDIRRTISQTQIADVVVGWEQENTIIVNKNPQGMLPTITSMKDANNQPLKWDDYYLNIGVDEFLKDLTVRVQVNADFADLPVHSVEVNLNYPHGPNAAVKPHVFTNPDDAKTFKFIVHEGIRKYKYSYKVNYKDSQVSFQSQEIETDDPSLIISVGDLSILSLDIAPGDINFGQVDRAMITVRYDDAGTAIEKKYNMTKTAANFRLREVLSRPRSGAVTYQITYQMSDGREIKTSEREQHARELNIDDPFTAIKTFGFRAIGDLENDIASIALAVDYVDQLNNYRQSTQLNLSKSQPFFDWHFPVIDEDSGTLTYSGAITFKNGTTTDIPETVAKRSIVQVGNRVADFLEVAVVPDLINWSLVKLVNVSLSYADVPNGVNERMDVRFKSGEPEKRWKVALKDASKTSYAWTSTFFLQDGSRKVVGPNNEVNLSIFPELPS